MAMPAPGVLTSVLKRPTGSGATPASARPAAGIATLAPPATVGATPARLTAAAGTATRTPVRTAGASAATVATITGGVTCVINKQDASYGCSGPLPGAPDGANLVSAGPAGAPVFSTTDRPLFAAAGEAKPLPAGTRLSFREISCGMDGAGVVACVNTRDQVGFMVTPTGVFIDESNPLLDRPQGTNPYLPWLPAG